MSAREGLANHEQALAARMRQSFRAAVAPDGPIDRELAGGGSFGQSDRAGIGFVRELLRLAIRVSTPDGDGILVDALSDRHPEVRSAAASAISRAEELSPVVAHIALDVALDRLDESDVIRESSQTWFVRALLRGATRSGDPSVQARMSRELVAREAAAAAHGASSASPRPMSRLRSLLPFVKPKTVPEVPPRIRPDALAAIARALGPVDDPAVRERLKEAALGVPGSYWTSDTALELLARSDDPPGEIVEQLIDNGADPHGVAALAAAALRAAGAADRPRRLADLARCLAASDGSLRSEVLERLPSLDLDPQERIELLRPVLQDEHLPDRVTVARMLMDDGDAASARAAIDVLEACLVTGQGDADAVALAAGIGRVADASEPALVTVRTILRDDIARVTDSDLSTAAKVLVALDPVEGAGAMLDVIMREECPASTVEACIGALAAGGNEGALRDAQELLAERQGSELLAALAGNEADKLGRPVATDPEHDPVQSAVAWIEHPRWGSSAPDLSALDDEQCQALAANALEVATHPVSLIDVARLDRALGVLGQVGRREHLDALDALDGALSVDGSDFRSGFRLAVELVEVRRAITNRLPDDPEPGVAAAVDVDLSDAASALPPTGSRSLEVDDLPDDGLDGHEVDATRAGTLDLSADLRADREGLDVGERSTGPDLDI